MEKRKGGTNSPIPTFAMHAEAMTKCRRFAEAFMEHVYLLTEARSAYEEVMSISTELHNKLDAGDQILTSLMTRLERVVSNHLSEPLVDRKKPELVKKRRLADSEERRHRHWESFSIKIKMREGILTVPQNQDLKPLS